MMIWLLIALLAALTKWHSTTGKCEGKGIDPDEDDLWDDETVFCEDKGTDPDEDDLGDGESIFCEDKWTDPDEDDLGDGESVFCENNGTDPDEDDLGNGETVFSSFNKKGEEDEGDDFFEEEEDFINRDYSRHEPHNEFRNASRNRPRRIRFTELFETSRVLHRHFHRILRDGRNDRPNDIFSDIPEFRNSTFFQDYINFVNSVDNLPRTNSNYKKLKKRTEILRKLSFFIQSFLNTPINKNRVLRYIGAAVVTIGICYGVYQWYKVTSSTNDQSFNNSVQDVRASTTNVEKSRLSKPSQTLNEPVQPSQLSELPQPLKPSEPLKSSKLLTDLNNSTTSSTTISKVTGVTHNTVNSAPQQTFMTSRDWRALIFFIGTGAIALFKFFAKK